jgi:hypothetical protein
MTRTWVDMDPGWYVVARGGRNVGPMPYVKALGASRAVDRHADYLEMFNVPEPTDMDVLRKANGVT